MDKGQGQESKSVLSAYIGIAGPETPKYLLANNFLSEFFQAPSEKDMPEMNYQSFKRTEILTSEEDNEQKKKQLERSFDRFLQRFSGLDSIKSNYKNKSFYFPLHPQMLKSTAFNLRHLLYNMLPEIEKEEKFRKLQDMLQEYLYQETTGVNYLLNELYEKLFQGEYRKYPSAKDPEYARLFKRKQYRQVCKNFEEDLYRILGHPFFKKLDFYKKYDYLATLLNSYVIQFIMKKDTAPKGGGGGCVLCQGSATSHLLSGGAFHRACVQDYAELREVFPKEMKKYYILQMNGETDETDQVYVWERKGKLFVGKKKEGGEIREDGEPFLQFVNRVFNSHYKDSAAESLYASVKRAFRITEENCKYDFDRNKFVTFYMDVSQARRGSMLTKISSTLPTCGKDIAFVFPNNRSRHKFFALSPSLLEFYVRLYLARKDRTYAYLDIFLADLEERYGICTQKSEKMDAILKRLRIKVPFQEFRQNEQALLENLDEINCLVRLSDSGYVITLPEEKGEFRLL